MASLNGVGRQSNGNQKDAGSSLKKGSLPTSPIRVTKPSHLLGGVGKMSRTDGRHTGCHTVEIVI